MGSSTSVPRHDGIQRSVGLHPTDSTGALAVKPKKLLLLGVAFGADNRGICALAAGAVAMLLNRYPDAEISLVDYGVEAHTSVVEAAGGVVTVSLVNLRFSKKLLLPNNVVYLLVMASLLRFASPRMREALIARNPWLCALCEADIAFAVSGGDSFSDIYGLGRFLYMSLPQLLVTMLNKRLVLLPQTIGPFSGAIARAIARFLIGRAELSYSRDIDGVRESKELLSGRRNNLKIRFCHDMGFLLEPRKPPKCDLGGLEGIEPCQRPLVGLNVSGLLYIGGYSRSNMFRLKVDYRELIASIIQHFIEKDTNVLLVPHVFGDQDESDTLAVQGVYSELKQKYPDTLFAVRGNYDEGEIKHIIGLCDFFVGARMHACIAALSQNIPTVGIAYSQKFLGVLDSIGVGQLVADPRNSTIEEILARLENTFAQRAEIRARLRSTIAQVRNGLLSALDGVE